MPVFLKLFLNKTFIATLRAKAVRRSKLALAKHEGQASLSIEAPRAIFVGAIAQFLIYSILIYII